MISALVAAAPLQAQTDPENEAGGVRAVIANLAPMPRKDSWVSFAVPEATVPKGPAEFAPQGWPVLVGDPVGPRARLVHVLVAELDPSEHAYGTIRACAPKPLPAAPARRPAGSNPVPTLLVTHGDGEVVRFRPAQWETVESGPARSVLHGWGRVAGTKLVVHAWFYVYACSRVVPFELLVANSDPRVPDRVQSIGKITLETPNGVFAAVDFHVRRGGRPPARSEDVVTTPLLGATWLGDGQGLAWRGSLLLWEGWTEDEAATLQAELMGPIAGQALDWSGHWGPWGVTPELHPAEATPLRGYGQVAASELRNRFVRDMARAGSIWDEPRYGLNRKPSGTGDQQDFGVTKLAPALAPPRGNPFHLWELSHSVLWEACRPSWFYEADGRRIRAGDHPKLVFWGLTPHWHTGVSEDRLGKDPDLKNPWNHGMAPKDWAHMSSNNLAGWTILTGSWLGRHLCAHEIEGWLLGSRLDRGLGEIRANGRALLGPVWCWLATGDPRVPERILARWKSSYDYLLDPERDGWQVRALGYGRPDGRYFKGKWHFWLPWQEALAIQGMDAAAQIAPHPKAERILTVLSRNLMRWGWWRDTDGRWVVGHSLRYKTGEQEGEALTPLEYRDPMQASNHYGTAFDVWSWPAVIVARRWLAKTGDDELVARCDEILAQLERGWRSKPAPVGFDRESEWRAVR